MNKIEIELGMWESAPCPICTKDVDLDRAEELLYQSAVMEYGETEVKKLLAQDGNKNWTRKWEKFQEWLCAEEESIIMECGGKYIEDMTDEEYNAVYGKNR